MPRLIHCRIDTGLSRHCGLDRCRRPPSVRMKAAMCKSWARAFGLRHGGCARKVLVTVGEIVPVGTLRRRRAPTSSHHRFRPCVGAGRRHPPPACIHVTDYQALSETLAARETPLGTIGPTVEGVPQRVQEAAKVRTETVVQYPALTHGEKQRPSTRSSPRIAANSTMRLCQRRRGVAAGQRRRLAKATHAPT